MTLAYFVKFVKKEVFFLRFLKVNDDSEIRTPKNDYCTKLHPDWLSQEVILGTCLG